MTGSPAFLTQPPTDNIAVQDTEMLNENEMFEEISIWLDKMSEENSLYNVYIYPYLVLVWNRDHSGYGLCQWEMTLHCDTVSFAEPIPRMISVKYCQP